MTSLIILQISFGCNVMCNVSYDSLHYIQQGFNCPENQECVPKMTWCDTEPNCPNEPECGMLVTL